MTTSPTARTRNIAVAVLLFLAIEPCYITSYPLAARCSLPTAGGGGGGGGGGGFGLADIRASGASRGRCGLSFQIGTGSYGVVSVPMRLCGRTIAWAGSGGGSEVEEGVEDGGEGWGVERGEARGDDGEKIEKSSDGHISSLQPGSGAGNAMASRAFNRKGGPISFIAALIRSTVKFFASILNSLFISKFSIVRRLTRGLLCDWLLAKRAWRAEMSMLSTKMELDRRSDLLKKAFDEDEEDADMIDIVDKLDFNGKDISADDVVQLGVSAREEWLRKGLGLGPDVSEEEIEKFIENKERGEGEEPRRSTAEREAAEEEELDLIVDRLNAKSQKEAWEKLAKAGGADALDDFREMMGLNLEELGEEDLAKWSNPEWLRSGEVDADMEPGDGDADVMQGDWDAQVDASDGVVTVDEVEGDGESGGGRGGELAVRGEVEGGGGAGWGESWVETVGRGFSRAVTGIVPLIAAVEDGNEDGVKLLLAKGADVQETGWDGKNALQVAMELGDDRMVRILVLGMQRRKPRFISVDDVANKAQKDPREVYARANRGPRRGDARRRAFRAEDWQRVLSPREFECLRLGRTEPPYSSRLHNETSAGVYSCLGCGTACFHSAFKFESKEGYPSFFNAIANGIRVGGGRGVELRKEVLCSCCDSHLGFVWADGWMYQNCPVDTRFCINGAGIAFSPEERRMTVD